MKLVELFESIILNELHEILPLEFYGCWFNAQTRKLLPVSGAFGHEPAMLDFISDNDIDDQNDSIYIFAWKNHWLRVVHNQFRDEGRTYTGHLVIQGQAGDIKKAWAQLGPTAIRTDFVTCGIVSLPLNPKAWESPYKLTEHTFSIPIDRSKMIRFVSSL